MLKVDDEQSAPVRGFISYLNLTRLHWDWEKLAESVVQMMVVREKNYLILSVGTTDTSNTRKRNHLSNNQPNNINLEVMDGFSRRRKQSKRLINMTRWTVQWIRQKANIIEDNLIKLNVGIIDFTETEKNILAPLTLVYRCSYREKSG